MNCKDLNVNIDIAACEEYKGGQTTKCIVIVGAGAMEAAKLAAEALKAEAIIVVQSIGDLSNGVKQTNTFIEEAASNMESLKIEVEKLNKCYESELRLDIDEIASNKREMKFRASQDNVKKLYRAEYGRRGEIRNKNKLQRFNKNSRRG